MSVGRGRLFLLYPELVPALGPWSLPSPPSLSLLLPCPAHPCPDVRSPGSLPQSAGVSGGSPCPSPGCLPSPRLPCSRAHALLLGGRPVHRDLSSVKADTWRVGRGGTCRGSGGEGTQSQGPVAPKLYWERRQWSKEGASWGNAWKDRDESVAAGPGIGELTKGPWSSTWGGAHVREGFRGGFWN